MAPLKIKVCGLKNPANIAAVAALSPDYMGFIFYDKTPRFVRDLSLQTLKAIPSNIIKTAVFVNEDAASINALVDTFGFNAIQLHGNESPEFCAQFKGKVTVLKAFGIGEDFDFESLNAYANVVDFFLFDAKTDIYGGSGKTFDWAILDKYKLEVPFFLSGGISLDNLAEIKDITHPRFYGLDLNSRFETSPGEKDIKKLEKALATVKTVEYL
jgi:phosphoribosylanthranilate isomerase